MSKDESTTPDAPEEAKSSDAENAEGNEDAEKKSEAPKYPEPYAAVLRVDESELAPLELEMVTQLRTIYDPEIPVDIYELGLIYEFSFDETGKAWIRMTLTSPMCPVAGTLPGEVQAKMQSVDGITQCDVDLVFDPPWTPQLMTDAARLALNMGGMNL